MTQTDVDPTELDLSAYSAHSKVAANVDFRFVFTTQQDCPNDSNGFHAVTLEMKSPFQPYQERILETYSCSMCRYDALVAMLFYHYYGDG
jgi:hypothetical protein